MKNIVLCLVLFVSTCPFFCGPHAWSCICTVYLCTYMYLHPLYTYIHSHTHSHTHSHLCIHARTHTHIHTHLFTHTLTHTHTHTHTHTTHTVARSAGGTKGCGCQWVLYCHVIWPCPLGPGVSIGARVSRCPAPFTPDCGTRQHWVCDHPQVALCTHRLSH